SLQRATVTGRADGGAVSFAGASIDVDDRVAREEALRAARERAEAADRAKDDLVAHVSHELRTPMAAIIGFAELLLDDGPAPSQVAALQTMKAAGASLIAILNDLLDFSKVEVGKIALEAKPWSPRATLAETLRALAPRAREKGLELIGNVEPEVPESLVGD